MLKVSLYFLNDRPEDLDQRIIELFKTERTSFSNKGSMVSSVKRKLGITGKMECCDKEFKIETIYKTNACPFNVTLNLALSVEDCCINAILVYDDTDGALTPVIFRSFDTTSFENGIGKINISISNTYLPEYVNKYLKGLKNV